MSIDKLMLAKTASLCPVCASHQMYYLFSVRESRVVSCHDCGLIALDRAIDGFNPTNSFPVPPAPRNWAQLLAGVDRHDGSSKLRSLYLGHNFDDFAAHVPKDWSCESLALPDPFESTCSDPDIQAFDIVVLDEVANQVVEPRRLLTQARQWLRPEGKLVITTPDLATWSGRPESSGSNAGRPRGMLYLNATVLQSLLFQCSFRKTEVHARHTPPRDGEACTLVCRPVEIRARLKLSVIVPVFNEAATAGIVLEKLTAKALADLDLEIIIIESNSSDDSREVVQRFAGVENVKLVFEDRPRGKGHAVRTALEHASGDFVLIQDADLEYDLEDYEALLEPLVAGRRAFVLGARHGGNSWKIRRFTDQPFQALALNLAHHAFTFLINVSLGLRLDDPFTMFKVFRRDCLHGLRLECNRFDFDWELLIKLVRKGHRPLEIPVNYRSRSFKEGKKIRVWRDPVTWIIAWAKARFGPLT